MSFTALEYARQADLEYWGDVAFADLLNIPISLPGAQFTLWISPIFTHRSGPTDFTSNGRYECIRIKDITGDLVAHEFRDGSVCAAWLSLYWPAERKERQNLGGRLS